MLTGQSVYQGRVLQVLRRGSLATWVSVWTSGDLHILRHEEWRFNNVHGLIWCSLRAVYPSSSYYSEPLVRRSVASSSLWKTGFYNKEVRVRFTVDKVAVEWTFHRHLDLPPSVYFHLSWARAIHLSPSHLLKIHFNTFLSTPRSSKRSLSLVSHHQDPQHNSLVSHTCHTPRPSHSSQFGPPNNIWWEVQILKLLIMYSSPLPYYLAPLRTRTGGRNL